MPVIAKIKKDEQMYLSGSGLLIHGNGTFEQADGGKLPSNIFIKKSVDGVDILTSPPHALAVWNENNVQ